MKQNLIFVVVFFLLGVGYYLFQLSQKPTLFIRHEDPVQEIGKAILFTGDIMLGRYVDTLAHNEKDPMRSFQNVHAFLNEHVTIANLEGPIPLVYESTPQHGMVFSFPSYTPQILEAAGIKAVSLANNHMYDRRKNGQEETRYALEKSGVNFFGGYAPETSFFKTKFGNTEVIVFGLAMISSLWDEKEALEVARTLRYNHPDAHLIAFMHWGDEYVIQNRYQRAFAHKLIDLGVDAIVGAHPHVVQGIEVHNGKPIFYSLGNFVFDQYWRKDLENGLFIRLSEKGNSYRYELIPIHSSRSVPYIATSTKRDEILSSIAGQSDKALRDSILRGMVRFERKK